MGTGMKGSYLGFTFNGIHSSTFGITRTSDGSRFNQNLLPTIQDKSVPIPGRPGAVLQSSNYGTKVFNVPIAYDEMTEQQLQEFSAWLGDKKVHELVFDELPYKHWRAKVTGTASMKWIPFAEGEVNRIYKGEGTIQFTCYEPFARCPNTWIFDGELDDKKEWWEASGLSNREGRGFFTTQGIVDGQQFILNDKILSEEGLAYLDTIIKGQKTWSRCDIYNCGDLETDFKIKLFTKNPTLYPGGIYLFEIKELVQDPDHTVNQYALAGALCWDEIVCSNYSSELSWGIEVDSKMNLLKEFGANKNTIHDQYIKDGTYFKLPKGKLAIFWDYGNNNLSQGLPTINFDHLYF